MAQLGHRGLVIILLCWGTLVPQGADAPRKEAPAGLSPVALEAKAAAVFPVWLKAASSSCSNSKAWSASSRSSSSSSISTSRAVAATATAAGGNAVPPAAASTCGAGMASRGKGGCWPNAPCGRHSTGELWLGELVKFSSYHLVHHFSEIVVSLCIIHFFHGIGME